MGAVLEKAKMFFDAYIVNIFKDFGVFDVVDILLLTVILYFIYRFVRERRAGKLLIGLGCILIFSLIGAQAWCRSNLKVRWVR